LLHHRMPHGKWQAQRPLTMGDSRQDVRQVRFRLCRSTCRTRRAPPSPFA
jgi:hypothetical protein